MKTQTMLPLYTSLEYSDDHQDHQQDPDDILRSDLQDGFFIEIRCSNRRCDGNFFTDDFEEILQKRLLMFQEYFPGKGFGR
jgi:hypothetical protein